MPEAVLGTAAEKALAPPEGRGSGLPVAIWERSEQAAGSGHYGRHITQTQAAG